MPPLAIAAGIGAVASIGGAVIGAGAQRSAARTAANTSRDNNIANAQLAADNRNFAQGVLQPYSNAGLAAQGVLSNMLTGADRTGALSAPGTDWNAYLQAHPDALEDYTLRHAGEDVATYGQRHWRDDGARRDVTAFGGRVESAPTAWDQFRNSTNYDFRFNEGMKSMNLGMANNGLAGSGAAVKEAIKYGQNFASNEVGNYMQLLQGQQQIGMGAASAMVGVGQNTTNALMAGNNANASNQANAALVRGNATANMWGGIAGGIGQAAGALGSAGVFGGGSSYGGGGGLMGTGSLNGMYTGSSLNGFG